MNCVIYANCQGGVLKEYLRRHGPFDAKFASHVHLLSPQLFSRPMTAELLGQFRKADLFIHMVVEADSPTVLQQIADGAITQRQGRFFATDFIRGELLPKRCVSISLPNCHFEGYHIDYAKDPRNALTVNARYPWGMFPYGGKKLMEQLEKSKPLTEKKIHGIIDAMNSPDLHAASEINGHLKKTLGNLREKESACTLKISRFIEENFRGRRLFNAVNHPAHPVFNELADQIVGILGQGQRRHTTLDPLGHTQIPISPCVIRHHGLSFFAGEPRYNALWSPRKVTHNEYLAKYIHTLYETYGKTPFHP
jgi:hypothetical protein